VIKSGDEGYILIRILGWTKELMLDHVNLITISDPRFRLSSADL